MFNIILDILLIISMLLWGQEVPRWEATRTSDQVRTKYLFVFKVQNNQLPSSVLCLKFILINKIALTRVKNFELKF